jgi:hypothetical protein
LEIESNRRIEFFFFTIGNLLLSRASKKYKINSIPRYMIIDKSGTIVRPEAPRPSSPETLDLLLKLME